MCGIAAIFNYRTGLPVNSEELTAIRDAMTTRGPDGCGNWLSPDRRVGLGHRRLSIIDLSDAGAQPMQNHDGSLVITFNGEIYNYRELRAQLEAKGRRFASQTDTEILLHLYELEGAAMLDKLRGMFAVAIWDNRKSALFLARDPFGIKPLYYADDGKTLRAASQVKALLAGGQIDTTPEAAGHVGFFLWGHVPAPFTLYRGISKLPAGHWMWVPQDGAPKLHSYCDISSVLAEAEAKSEIRNQKAEISNFQFPISNLSSSLRDPLNPQSSILNAALRDSVRAHLIADVPIGVFLSSGLDSTTIAALAAQTSATLRTVTLGFEEFRGTANDEVPLAEQVAALYGARHQTIWITKNHFRDNFTNLMQAMDQPTCDGINSYFISLAANQAGLKVALSGLGGDELFGGYPSFHDIPRSVSALRALRFAPGISRAFRVISAPLIARLTSPKYAGLLEYGGTYAGAYLLRRGMFMPWELPGLLDPDMVREGWKRLQPLAALDSTLSTLHSPRLKVSALEMTWYMRQQLLRDTDWASMRHSLEVRTPLVDIQLLKDLAPLLASGTPPGKRDMANAVGEQVESRKQKAEIQNSEISNFQFPISNSPGLPASVLNRKKTGFITPIRDWLLSDFPISNFEFSISSRDRGLRGWTKLVYRNYLGQQIKEGRSKIGRAEVRSQKTEVRGQRTEGKGQKSEVRSQRSGDKSPQSSILNPQSLPRQRKILIFRIGQLGDTIVALPAIWAVKKHFPDAHISLLCDRHPGKKYVLASDLFKNTGIFDEYLSYPVTHKGDILKPWRMASLLAEIKRRNFHTLVYLAPTSRTPEQILRDRRFFKLAGIREFIGMEGFTALPFRDNGNPLAEVHPESELLLNRLAASNFPISPSDKAAMDLALGRAEEEAVDAWLNGLETDGARPWVAIAPGSKMPAKRWELARFAEVVDKLIHNFDIWPVVFGGPEDRLIGDELIKAWGRGHNAAGALGLRPAIAALKRCFFYLGNDTGTMHMAASVGVRCVAIFSARDRPGLWYPHGPGHRILRTPIDCEGCALTECLDRKNECLTRITVGQVLEACEALLKEVQSSKIETLQTTDR